jgi:predicted esterase
MLPFEPDVRPALQGVRVFIGAGRNDPLVPIPQVDRLATLLKNASADVTVHWTNGGHGITPDEFQAARDWMAGWAD